MALLSPVPNLLRLLIVAALCAVGLAVSTPPARAATPAGPVQELTAAQSDSGVVLTWSAPTTGVPDFYVVVVDGNDAGAQIVGEGAVTHVISGVPLGQHSFVVFAVVGDDAAEASVLYTVVDSPPVPTSVRATQVRGDVHLTWAPPPGVATNYKMRMDGGPWQLQSAPMAAVFSDVAGGDHTIDLITTTKGAGAAYTQVTVSVLAAPTDVRAAQRGSLVTLSWQPPSAGPSPSSYYVVLLRNGVVVQQEEVLAPADKWLYADLAPGTYTWEVISSNGDIYGHSGTAIATVVAKPAPVAGLGVTRQGSDVKVGWTPGAGGGPASAYRVQLDGGAPVTVLSPSHTFAGVPGGPHTVTVVAVNAAGESPAASVAVPAATVGSPMAVKARRGMPGGPLVVIVSWKAPAAVAGVVVSGYQILATKVGRGRPLAKTVTVRKLVELQKKVAPGAGRWTFRVRALTASAPGPWSAPTRAVRPR